MCLDVASSLQKRRKSAESAESAHGSQLQGCLQKVYRTPTTNNKEAGYEKWKLLQLQTCKTWDPLDESRLSPQTRSNRARGPPKTMGEFWGAASVETWLATEGTPRCGGIPELYTFHRGFDCGLQTHMSGANKKDLTFHGVLVVRPIVVLHCFQRRDAWLAIPIAARYSGSSSPPSPALESQKSLQLGPGGKPPQSGELLWEQRSAPICGVFHGLIWPKE